MLQNKTTAALVPPNDLKKWLQIPLWLLITGALLEVMGKKEPWKGMRENLPSSMVDKVDLHTQKELRSQQNQSIVNH